MKLIQRLGSAEQYDDAYTDEILRNYREHGGSVDEVWLATSYGFPPLDVHIENAKRLSRVAKKFRDAGMSVSLQLSNTLGHGQYMSSCDCSGLVSEGGADPVVGEDGTVARYCFCPRGEKMRAYLLCEVEAYVSETLPDCLWIDDDFRADNHNPVNYGCFCDACIARFNEREKTSYTREELLSRILHEEGAKTRLAFMNFTKEALSDLMAELCRTVHRVSPKTDVGLQNASHGYTGYGLAFLYDAIYREIGRPPLVRPGGGSYNDHNPNDLLYKTVDVAYQHASMPKYVKTVAPEIENLPFHYSGKSAAGTALETSLYLASGSTDMTYSMMMHTPEEPAFYERFFRLFAENRPYWERLSALSRGSVGGGLSLAIAKEFFLRPVGEGKGIRAYAEESYHGADLLYRTGLPLAFDETAGAPLLLYPDVARAMSEKEVKALLSKRVITDGETIGILRGRGFFDNIGVHFVKETDALRLTEYYTENKFSAGLRQKSYHSNFFTAGRNGMYAFDRLPANVEILGTYGATSRLDPLFDGEFPYGVASFLFDTEEGGRFAVFGTGLWKGNIPSSRLRLLLRVADAVASRPLPALPETAEQAALFVRVDGTGEHTLGVSVVNLTIAPLSGMTLRVRRATGTPLFAGQYEKEEILTAKRDGEDLLVTLPQIAPYSVATVFFPGAGTANA